MKFIDDGYLVFWWVVVIDLVLVSMFCVVFFIVDGMFVVFLFDIDIGDLIYVIVNSYDFVFVKYLFGKLFYWCNLVVVMVCGG